GSDVRAWPGFRAEERVPGRNSRHLSEGTESAGKRVPSPPRTHSRQGCCIGSILWQRTSLSVWLQTPVAWTISRHLQADLQCDLRLAESRQSHISPEAV